MKVLLALVVIGLGALYYFMGIKVGLLPDTPLYALNVQGKSEYPFRLYGTGQIDVKGSCDVKSGSATVNFLAPDGTPITNPVKCIKGKWSLNMGTQGSAGFYRVTVNYKHFTGILKLQSTAQVTE